MYFIQLNKPKFFYLFVALVVTFGFVSILVKAEEEYLTLPEKTFEVTSNKDINYPDRSSENDVFDYNAYKTNDHYVTHKNKTNKYKIQSDPLFNTQNEVTFNDLLMRASFIVLFLLGVFILAKFLFFRNSFDKPGNFLNYLTQKFNNSFSSSSNLKLIQSLMLVPGQCIYVIEVDSKKLLIGGTQQGGIQFLADLSKPTSDLSSGNELNFRQLEESQIQTKTKHVSEELSVPFSISKLCENGNEENKEKDFQNKHTFKRRINFRQTLLDNPDKMNSCTLNT